jgi:hypothetical protein
LGAQLPPSLLLSVPSGQVVWDQDTPVSVTVPRLDAPLRVVLASVALVKLAPVSVVYPRLAPVR